MRALVVFLATDLRFVPAVLVPDITVETWQDIDITIPKEIMDKIDFQGKITTKAGLHDDSPLPSWLKYDEENMRFTGKVQPGANKEYKIKVYMSDEEGNVAYVIFKITVVDVYVPSMRVMGLTEGRKATVLKRCLGPQCTDEYIEESVIGEEVVTQPK